MLPLCKQPADQFFLTSGKGEGSSELTAFDSALLDAGIGDLNLVRVTSIIPPGCSQVDAAELPPGALAPAALATITSSETKKVISAAIAVALPVDLRLPGVIMEFTGAVPAHEAEQRARQMTVEAMKLRGQEIRQVISACATHSGQSRAAAVAAVLLLWSDR